MTTQDDIKTTPLATAFTGTLIDGTIAKIVSNVNAALPTTATTNNKLTTQDDIKTTPLATAFSGTLGPNSLAKVVTDIKDAIPSGANFNNKLVLETNAAGKAVLREGDVAGITVQSLATALGQLFNNSTYFSGGDFATTTEGNALRTAFEKTPLAQFKHLPNMSYLVAPGTGSTHGGGSKKRGSDKIKLRKSSTMKK